MEKSINLSELLFLYPFHENSDNKNNSNKTYLPLYRGVQCDMEALEMQLMSVSHSPSQKVLLASSRFPLEVGLRGIFSTSAPFQPTIMNQLKTVTSTALHSSLSHANLS